MFRNYLRLVRRRFEKISKAFRILEEGGTYERVLPLNLPERSRFQERYRLEGGIEVPPQFSPEPQMRLLKSKIGQLEKLVGEMLERTAKNEDRISVTMAFRHHLATTVKELDAIYRRLIENINQLLYRDQVEAASIVERTDALLRWQHRIQIFTITVLLLLVLLLGYLAFRNLSRLNRELSRRLYTDRLTGLKSRAALEERGIGYSECLMLIDILHFSEINDLYGMQTGDDVLRKVSERLRNLWDPETIYHIGGDTFAVLWENHDDVREKALEKAEELLRFLEEEPYEVRGLLFHLRLGAGVGRGEGGLDEAMIALDEAKQCNLPLRIYDDLQRDFLQKIRETRGMQKKIRDAISRDRIVPFIQPIYDRQGRLSSYELLMRIAIQDGEEILPDFDVAIHSRMYGRLSRTMIRKGLELMKGYPVSINLSYEDVRDPETRNFLERIVKSHSENGITFEILESRSISDFEVMREFLDHFRSKGVRIAIDDFGSDYSNLLRILKLSPDYIKIDGSLIQDLPTSVEAFGAVRSIVAYAKSLGISTVAEYVENAEIYRRCRELDIDFFQGYYLSRPFPATEIPPSR
jgi:diguanylate cyclase (GGDEF)-like protein